MLKFIWILILPFAVTCMEQNEDFVTEKKRSRENQCSANEDMTNVCEQCITLPFYGMTSLVTCCSDEYTFQFCQICVSDKESCRKLLGELESFNPMWMHKRNAKKSIDNDTNDRQLRMQRSSALAKIFSGPTLFRNLLSGKEKSLSQILDVENSELTDPAFLYESSQEADADRRYGRLFMKANQYFGKRGASKK